MDPYRHRHRAVGSTPRGIRHRWDVTVPGNVFGGPSFVGAFHVVVNVRGPGREGTVRALDVEDGHPVWEHRLAVRSNVTPTVDGNLVVVAGEDGEVAGLDADRGEVAWQVTLGGPVQGSPLVLADGVYVGVGLGRVPGGPGAVARISRDGTLEWEVDVGPAVAAGPTVFDDDHVLIATALGTIHTVETRGGEVRDLVVPAESDHDETDAPIIGSVVNAPPVRLPGLSVVLATSGTVLAIADDGGHRWSWSPPSAISSGELACDGAHVFVPGSDGRLLAVDAETGDLAWHVERLGRRGAALWSTPVVIGDTVMAISSTGVLVAVDAASGTEKFTEPVDGEPATSPLDGDEEGRFVVAIHGHEQRVTCWELSS